MQKIFWVILLVHVVVCQSGTLGTSSSSISHCLRSGNEGGNIVCQECEKGYYLTFQRNACNACAVECAECNGSAATCVSCSPTHYMTPDNRCVKCGFGCRTCKDSQNCISCDSGYFMAAANKCAACLSNCAYCPNAEKCTKCNSDYELNQNQGNGKDTCTSNNNNALWIVLGSIGGTCLLCCLCLCCLIAFAPTPSEQEKARQRGQGHNFNGSNKGGELEHYNNYNQYQQPNMQQGNYTLMAGQPAPMGGQGQFTMGSQPPMQMGGQSPTMGGQGQFMMSGQSPMQMGGQSPLPPGF